MRKSPQSARIFKVSYADNSELNELSGRVIGCAFMVLNTLGTGFLEKERYRDILVGEYFVDLLINDVLLVDLKTVKHWITRTCPGAGPKGRKQCTQLSESDGPATMPAA